MSQHALKLAEALTEALSVLELMEPPAQGDRDHQDSIAALGTRIGFGALMVGAEAEWRKISTVAGGEFVVGPCRTTVDKTIPAVRTTLAAYLASDEHAEDVERARAGAAGFQGLAKGAAPSDTAHPEGERELLPCPFCGAPALLEQENPAKSWKWSVECEDALCHAGPVVIGSTKEIAAERWNRRSAPTLGQEGLLTRARDSLKMALAPFKPMHSRAEAEAVLADLEATVSTPPSRPQGEEGLDQEPKYRFDGGRVINRASGEAIPQDEPVFVFRARDNFALRALDAYLCAFEHHHPDAREHAVAVRSRVLDFARFKGAHPERMKEPDTDISNQGKPSS